MMRGGREEIAHLLRRVAFGATPGDLDRTEQQGYEQTVEELVAAPAPKPSAIASGVRGTDDRAQIAGAVLHDLRASAAPLRETLALFWHNHFVSALAKVGEGRLMLDQLALFRTLGMGPFSTLVKAVARDPAMVRYLDLERSDRGRPNENFARELMELFTTGPGPYSEQDIREAARAFTGFHLRNGAFAYSDAAHDPGQKSVLGVRGPLSGDEVAQIVADHPSTASFVGQKLARHLVADEPDAHAVLTVEQAWRRHRGDLGKVVRDVLLSDAFRAPQNRFAVTRSPAVLVASTARILGSGTPPVAAAHRTFAMGQALLDPPTVKGYPGGRRWLNAATLLARRAYLLESVATARGSGTLSPALAGADGDPARAFEHLMGRAPAAAEIAAIDDALAAPDGRETGALEILICHPLFQMC